MGNACRKGPRVAEAAPVSTKTVSVKPSPSGDSKKRRASASSSSSSSVSSSLSSQQSSASAKHQSKGGDRNTRVGVFWDIENCPVPSGPGNGRAVVDSISGFANKFGRVFTITAHGNTQSINHGARTDLQQSGVHLVDVPPSRKEAADKALLVDMLMFAMDHPPPATLILITGDQDFAPGMSKLKHRGYDVVLVHPRNARDSLKASASMLQSWEDLVGHLRNNKRAFGKPQRNRRRSNSRNRNNNRRNKRNNRDRNNNRAYDKGRNPHLSASPSRRTEQSSELSSPGKGKNWARNQRRKQNRRKRAQAGQNESTETASRQRSASDYYDHSSSYSYSR